MTDHIIKFFVGATAFGLFVAIVFIASQMPQWLFWTIYISLSSYFIGSGIVGLWKIYKKQ